MFIDKVFFVKYLGDVTVFFAVSIRSAECFMKCASSRYFLQPQIIGM